MTKRIVSLSLAVILLLMMALSAALAEDNYVDPRAGYYYVKTENGKGLNVRNGPGGHVVGTLKYGAHIYVFGFTTAEWALINFKYDNGYGMGEYAAWVSTRYLSRTDPGKYQPTPVVPPVPVTPGTPAETLDSVNAIFRTARQVAAPYTVVARPARASGWVNLRWAPSTEAERIATCPQGKTLVVLAELKGWYQVQDPVTGMIGFIMSKYMTRQ